MKLAIDSQIFERFPDLKVGVIVIKGFNNFKRRSDVESLLRGISAQRAREFANKEVHQENMIYVWDQAYQVFGVNPAKRKPSIAALLDRVAEGEIIPHINPLVDLYNYFSLKYLLPIGSEDLDWLCGDLKLTFTHGGEAFRPIGSIDVKEANAGEVAYMDDGGITCRFWNYRECERTKLSEKTVNAAIMIEDLSKMHMDEFGMIMDDIQNSIVKYIGGEVSTHVINDENKEIDLGIQGRIRMDDSKVTAQEKAYYYGKKQQEQKILEAVEVEAGDVKPQGGDIEVPVETEVPNVMEPSNVELKPVEGDRIIEENAAENNGSEVAAASAEIPFESEELEETKLDVAGEELVKKKISQVLKVSLAKSFPHLGKVEVRIEYPEALEHGDYASNLAMQLAKEVGMAPREIAQKLVDNLDKGELIEKVEVAGPGFINFFLSETALKHEIEKVLDQKEKYGRIDAGEGKTVIIDYSQPNIAKPLGVHHLLSTVIGQSINNILKTINFNTIGVNYIGDWGTQFGKLIHAYKEWGDKEAVEKDPINELLKLYVQFHNEAERNPEIEDKARYEFKIFEDGDKENHKLWEWIVEESMKDVQKTYDRLGGIYFDHVKGEAFISDRLDSLLEEGKELGIFIQGEEGSYIVKYNDPKMPPCLVQKKDGATLYSTRDFATLKYRIQTYNPVKILYVVDRAQSLHFKQFFIGSARFPWFKNVAEHVVFGRMNMKDRKMSTRKGNVVLLDEVLDEAVDRVKNIISQKSPDLENIDETAEILGIGAIKYNVLSQNRETDMTFDWDRMLSFDGNSAPYLQYSYARAKSILRKRDEGGDDGAPIGDNEKTKERIESLIRMFPKFGEVLVDAGVEYKPNILCNYLFELAQEFNSFYNSVSVLRADTEEKIRFRLKIVEAFSWIMRNGLELLGIRVVEKM